MQTASVNFMATLIVTFWVQVLGDWFYDDSGDGLKIGDSQCEWISLNLHKISIKKELPVKTT